MKGNRFFDHLKLRVGYGTTANCNVDDNMYVTAYGGGFYAINRQQVNTLVPGKLANEELVWEKTNSFNVRLDMAMFNNRVNLTLIFTTSNRTTYSWRPLFLHQRLFYPVPEYRFHPQPRCGVCSEYKKHCR